ncbi:MAG: cell division protein FtsA [Sphingomonadaceae bacterium]|nr:cell division protein FtsA [Sphingomonadaceae bacterium]
MAQGKNDDLITVLDIGTSKICAMIARNPADGDLQVLGTGQRESKGVSRGFISDIKLAETAIRGAVEQAERIAGVGVESAWVGFSAGGLVSKIVNIEADLGGHRIEQAHIDDLLAAGRDAIDPEGLHLLHAHPTLYTLDGLEGVKNPLGLHADQLGVDIHAVLAERSPVLNLEYCVGSAYLHVERVVAAPVATGLACLSAEERDLGVALVELGAGITNVSLFAGGMLVGLTSIPQGAADITDAIATQFGMRRAQAERLKCVHGSAMTSPRDNHEMLEVPSTPGQEAVDPLRVTRAQLNAVIRERLEELAARIAEALDAMGFTGPVGRQVVLTGGGAELKGIADFAQGVLGRSVRGGKPVALAGLPEAHSSPAFAALAGLARFAASAPLDLKTMVSADQLVHRVAGGGLWTRFKTAFKSEY